MITVANSYKAKAMLVENGTPYPLLFIRITSAD